MYTHVSLLPNSILVGIVVEGYAPLGSPTRFIIADSDPVVMEDPVINEIAAKKGATAAQVCVHHACYETY